MTPDVLTQMLRTEFLTAKMEAENRGPAPVESFMQKVPSAGRVEPFVFASAVGNMTLFKGYRTFSKFAADVYPITSNQYYNGFEVNKIDVDDDKVGIFPSWSRAVVDRSKWLPQQLALEALRDGETGLAFDGQPFFSQTHNVGSVKANTIASGEGGGNIITVTAASADGVNHKVVVVVNTGSVFVKPIIITERMGVTELQTDAGTPEAEKAQKYQYWVDARYGKGYGFWWDAVLIKITNTPTLAELQSYLAKAEVRLRSFLIAKDRDEDDDLSFHEQLNFNTGTVTALYGSPLTNLMRITLNNDVIFINNAGVTNAYKGWAMGVPTIYLNP